MASVCPRCSAARGGGRYCSQCAYDYWGAASGQEQEQHQPASTAPSQGPTTKSSNRLWLYLGGGALAVVLLAVVISVLGGGTGDPAAAGASSGESRESEPTRTPGPTVRPTTRPTTKPTARPTPAGPSKAQIGETVTITCSGDPCLEVTVSDPSEHASYAGDYFNDDPDQAGYVYMQVYVKYVSLQDGADYNQFDWDIYADGRQLDSWTFAVNGPEPDLGSGSLPSGRTAEGWLLYEVPPTGEVILSYAPNYNGAPIFEVVLRAG